MFWAASVILFYLFIYFFFPTFQEAAKFAEIQNLDTTDIKEIALKVASLPKENAKRPRIVVFTQGAENVILAKGGYI